MVPLPLLVARPSVSGKSLCDMPISIACTNRVLENGINQLALNELVLIVLDRPDSSLAQVQGEDR